MAGEQVAGTFVGSVREEVAILLLVKGIVLLRVAVSINSDKGRVIFQRYNGPGTHDGSFSISPRVLRLRSREISLPRPRADSRCRARIFIAEKCKGADAARTKRPERENRYFEAEASFSSRRAIVPPWE